ncbi:sigma-70 family RNA polymerase sigma factor [Megasphaera sp.]|uniref:sigma-70 family RNA polymerase sigma factor n=1 Tax=Megasphaera sp. TaxID=2023260 RepID=UPI001D4C2711|nr:sigma-70 family RNA polymerase sigma factor [Megasphaera sp.]MBS6104599.1 sigma-70 family RNA polymerase sigma factor [Megasphaera sp.]
MLEDYLQELQKITLLQPDEEAALWQAYKEGGDAGARSRLIEQYQPLVFKEAMRWNIHTDLLLDALQEGTLGLMEAVERYDHSRGVAFPLFAVHRIRGAILDYLKREGAVSAMSLDAPDEQGLTLQDTLCDDSQDPAEAASRQFLLEKVSGVLQRLPEKEQAVVEGVYLKDVEQKHLAKALDISLPYVYRLQKRGIRRVGGMLSRFIHDSRD